MWTLWSRQIPHHWHIIVLLLLGGLGLFLVGSASAATRYVATNGSGSTCSLASPCALGTGLSATGPGDTLFVRGGTYLGDEKRTVPCSTSASSPVTIRNYQNEQVIFKRATEPGRPSWNIKTGDCGYVLIEGSYNAATDTRGIVFDGMRITMGLASTSAETGGHHNTLRNVEIRNNHTSQINEGAHHMRLDNIDCHGVTESHCIYVNWNDSIIENSFFHHNTNHGIHWRKSSGDQGKCQPDCGTRRNIIRNTKIYNNRTGLNWAYGGENQFYNNLVYNHEHFGLNVGGIHGPNKFWNNTIWNNATGGQSSHGGLRLQACAEVKNNIVFGNGSQQIFGDVSCSTLSNNITAQNPLFVNQNAGDFHLKSGSPAINAGVNLSCCVPDDFDHADRLVGGTYDIGAYEFGGTAPTPGPGDTTPPSVPTGLTVQRDSDT